MFNKKEWTKKWRAKPENKEKQNKYRRDYYYRNLEAQKEINRKNRIKNPIYQYNLRQTDLKLYTIYWGMVSRCKYKSSGNYKYYGGRGIKCLWKKYEDFKKDMYDSYVVHLKKYGKKQTSIDRIDNYGHYCKENCRWATKREQNLNRRT